MTSIDWAGINWWAQIPFFIAAVYLIYRVVVGSRRGFVKELCSVISFIIASIAIMMIAFGVRNYFSHQVVLVVASIVLLILLGIVYKLLDLFFVTLKMVSKLPVISFINKLCGLLMGVVEAILLVWAVYCIVLIINPAGWSNWIMYCVNNNKIMAYLFNNNYMYHYVSDWYEKLCAMDILTKIGFR